MDISLLSCGIKSFLNVETHDDLSKHLTEGDEVRIVFPSGQDDSLLETKTGAFTLHATDEKSKSVMTNLYERRPACLCWVGALRISGNTSQLTIQVHVFEKEITSDTLSLGVDERIHKRHASRTNQPVEQTCQSLHESLVLPPFKEGESGRFIATMGSDGNKNFTIIGDQIEIDIAENNQSVLYVNRLTGKRRRTSTNDKVPLALVTSDIKFVDISIAAGQKQQIQSRLQNVLRKPDSYLGLWAEWNRIERDRLLEKAKKVGWVQYSSFRYLARGLWSFGIDDEKQLANFDRNIQSVELLDLGVSGNLPSDFYDAMESKDSYQIGEIVSIDLEQNEVLLKLPNSAQRPSKQGYLFAALKKDQAQLNRREKAFNNIMSANSNMPHLALILENEAFPETRIDREPPLTAAALEAFGDGNEPTPDQRKAIDYAINTPDIILIQGPPGTGKTQVISAINARLAEIGSGEATGRTLITSVQHSAVENVAAKTSVFGLPTIKLGRGKQGRGPNYENLDVWRKNVNEKIKAVLSTIDSQRPQSTYKDLRDRVASYSANVETMKFGRALLEEMRLSQSKNLSSDLIEEIDQLLRTPQARDGDDSNDINNQMKEQAVRNIRTRQESFLDDGPKMARRASKRLQDILTSEEIALLDEAASMQPNDEFPRLGELDELKTNLIRRLQPESAIEEPLNREGTVLQLLNKILIELKSVASVGRDGESDALHQYAKALENDPEGIQELLQHYGVTHAATCQQAVSKSVRDVKMMTSGSGIGLEYENIIIEEAAHANPLDLFIPMSLASRRIILVGDHRQLPHLLDTDIEKSIVEGIDQSSTTDSVQEEAQKNLKKSLFERLFKDLLSLSATTGIQRVVTLRDQFRMHPTLGKFVSDNFYAPYGEDFRSPRPAEEFTHGLTHYQKNGRPLCAVWKDIPHNAGKEIPGKSKCRPAEAKWIAKELKRILTTEEPDFTIGVITFYEAQRKEILNQLVNEGIAFRDEENGEIRIADQYHSLAEHDGQERLQIGTVDSFQGKEFDVVFLSITRSNSFPERTDLERRRKFGHVLNENRMCVAMSRQRRLLIAVGDKSMFQSNGSQEKLLWLPRFLDLCGGEDGIIL